MAKAQSFKTMAGLGANSSFNARTMKTRINSKIHLNKQYGSSTVAHSPEKAKRGKSGGTVRGKNQIGPRAGSGSSAGATVQQDRMDAEELRIDTDKNGGVGSATGDQVTEAPNEDVADLATSSSAMDPLITGAPEAGHELTRKRANGSCKNVLADTEPLNDGEQPKRPQTRGDHNPVTSVR